MKFHGVLASLVAVVATGSVMSMELEQQRAGQLNFLVNEKLEIIASSQNNMQLPEGFVGKTITELFPSTWGTTQDFNHGYLRLGFKDALPSETGELNGTTQASYTFDMKQFVAKIVGLQMTAGLTPCEYFVTVQEKAHKSTGLRLVTRLKDKRLNFLVDYKKCIRGYSRQNMDFALEPSEFIGKTIIYVLPLDKADRKAMISGFDAAGEQQKTVEVPYVFEGKGFVAMLTALETQNEGCNYFVEVTEVQ